MRRLPVIRFKTLSVRLDGMGNSTLQAVGREEEMGCSQIADETVEGTLLLGCIIVAPVSLRYRLLPSENIGKRDSPWKK